MLLEELSRHGANERLIELFDSMGVRELYPPQELAVQAGLLRDRQSIVVSAPTASGKTLVAEMALLKEFTESGGRAAYLVPLRALAREKYETLFNKYKSAGMKVMLSTGDYDGAEPWLSNADLMITTNEKMDSLIRHHAPLLSDISLLIADEIHVVGDAGRGPTLEIVLTRMRQMRPAPRIIALSATIPNAEEIAGWLGARLLQSDWRPVPLREGVFFNDAAIFNDGTVRWIPEQSSDPSLDIALDTIKEKGQALVFVNTRKSSEAFATKSATYLAGLLSEKEKQALRDVSEKVLHASPEPTRICRKLAECVNNGVAFHHAGILSLQRKLIEDAFKSSLIKLIAATTTLAMGLNLPSRTVIIRNWWRFSSGEGVTPIPAIEIKQMSGRAGRPGFDNYGEAILVARNRRDEKDLFERYIKGSPEKVESRLGEEPALRSHILASVAGAFARTRSTLIDFLEMTFFAFQQGGDHLVSLADGILRFLEDQGMMTAREEGFRATTFGRRVSELYIDPLTAVAIRDALSIRKEKNEFSLFHMLASTPDMFAFRVVRADYEEMLDTFYAKAGDLLLAEDEKLPTDKTLSEIKTASVLMQWIVEMPEDRIVERFGIGPGDLRTAVELADWLLYSAYEIARVFRLKEEMKLLTMLRVRVQYGVKKELLELVSLKGIGRIRARNLYRAGYGVLKDIERATAAQLAQVPAIGRGIAEDIKRQVSMQGEKAVRE